MDDVSSVSSGVFHPAVIKKDGSIWSWGYTDAKSLGGSSTVSDKLPSIKILDNVHFVSAGWFCTLIIKNDGSLWGWGQNLAWQLGNKKEGTNACIDIPEKIMDSIKIVSENQNPIPKNNTPPNPMSVPVPDKPITVTIDNVPVEFETPPRLINDRIMIQIRAVAERLGCSVEWDKDTQISYINDPGIPIQKTAVKGTDISVYVNNQPVSFPDQQPAIIDNYLLIPCRGVVEALGHSVNWDNTTHTQAITTNRN